MWVKNQDGISVVNTDALALDPVEIAKEDAKFIRIWGTTADHDYIMGVYKTIEDAKAVLKDFANAVVNKFDVYEMPKADEIPAKEVQ